MNVSGIEQNRRRDQAASRRSGFTLVEVLVASALSTLVVVAIIGSFLQYRHTIRVQQQNAEIQSSLRTSSMVLSRDVALSGYGLRMYDYQLPLWITWVHGFAANPTIIKGEDNECDVVTMAAAYDRIALLSENAAAGSSSIIVGSGEGINFNTTDRSLIYVGGCELVRITAVQGDILTVSAHPGLATGLRYSHPAGSTVERIRVVSYSVVPVDESNLEVPYLRRSIHRPGGEHWHHEVVVPGIEHLRVDQEGEALTFVLRAVSSQTDHRFTEHEDNRRRGELSTTVHMRNLRQ